MSEKNSTTVFAKIEEAKTYLKGDNLRIANCAKHSKG